MKKTLLLLTCVAALSANAQQGGALSDKDYERAEGFMYNLDELIDNAVIRPNWLPGDKFWYTTATPGGTTFMLADPSKKTNTAAFDHQKLAGALSRFTGKSYTSEKLPFRSIGFSADGKSVLFSAEGKNLKFDLKKSVVAENPGGETVPEPEAPRPMRGRGSLEVISPDGKKAAFLKDYNLWVKEISSGKQTQLTTDGVKDFGYATDNAGWKSGDGPIIRWSPDSKKMATFKQDQRNVSDMYLVTTNVGKPALKAWKYPLPGDKEIIMIHRVIVDVENPRVIPLKIAADPHRATLSDDIASSGTFDDVDWKADGSELAFLSTSRDHKHEKLRIADATTGAVREVFEEIVKTQFESGRGAINWRYLPDSKEILWYSERDNWGHMYLYDSETGKLKNQITKGDWLVSRVIRIDEKNRVLYFMGHGREPGNPYYGYFYKIGFDGSGLTLLTPALGTHSVAFSPSGNYFMDTYSQPDVPPAMEYRDLNGGLLADLGKADISRLQAKGWKAPAPVKLIAHDGKTDIYGLVFTPVKPEAGKKYPVVNYIYPGPQGGSVRNWSFAASRGDHQALAELGFVVVLIEGTSNPYRSKSFHDMNYGNMAENTIPDQITGIRQLAATYPIDTTKVGVWGHSGGGFATASAMFKYPDFYKVGISESGNHDNRNYEDDWGERYIGLAENNDYESQANQNYAKNLKGKLLLAHGMMDNNVPPYNTLLVADALIKANKDFDLLIFPGSAHSFGQFSPYMMRRRWDYFVQHLQGRTPPAEYQIKGPSAQRNP